MLTHIPADELIKKSYGKSLYKIWYPAGSFFSFVDLFFDIRPTSKPEVFGSWYIAQDSKRRYVFTLADFQFLASEIEYICSNKTALSECEFPESFESMALKSVGFWDGPLKLRIYYEEDTLQLEFINHPGASGKFSVASPELLTKFIWTTVTTWMMQIPALPLGSIWILPFGGAYSVFDDDTEYCILPSEDALAIAQYLSDLTSSPEGKRFSAEFGIDITSSGAILKFPEKSVEVSFRELEIFRVFLMNRLFLKEQGEYVKWRDQTISAFRSKKPQL